MSLVVKDLTKRYGDKVVVDHLSFAMSQPGVYALLGTNGAGKTTSIRMMLNMLSRDGGYSSGAGEHHPAPAGDVPTGDRGIFGGKRDSPCRG